MLKRALREAKNILLAEIRLSLLHYVGSIRSTKYNNQTNLRLNLACGPTFKKGWLNIDIYPLKNILTLDLRKNLPFKNNSCIEVYSEHFLEHLEYPSETMHFLSEIYRVLHKGGKITIGVPDSEWPLKSYSQGYSAKYFSITKQKNWHPENYSTRMEHINFHFRQDGEHKYAYDRELLTKVLKKAGFIKINQRPFNPKTDYRQHHPGTIYLTAVK